LGHKPKRRPAIKKKKKSSRGNAAESKKKEKGSFRFRVTTVNKITPKRGK